MNGFTKRNLLIFFRDRSAVFFSLLSSFIIIGLYVLFLGDVWTSNFDKLSNARELMDNWVMAGLLAATSVTTTMGAFGVMINDKSRKIIKDFYSSPVSRHSLAGGYVLSAFIIGLIMSLITLVLAEVYIVAEGGAVMSIQTLAKVLVLLLLADFSNTAMVFFFVTFLSSESAFATASTIIGTLIGFVTGIYLPIGVLPEAVQTIVKLFPPSYAALLLRQAMMKNSMTAAFKGIPDSYKTDFDKMLGVTFRFGSTEVGVVASIAILLATGTLFFALAVIRLSRKKK